ncbi:MAG TPA: hypothetical protein VFQ51_12500 [Vicinamibacteria bacterium]|nr:hypothetical protein [Vicinamibacteria bacterium]
MPARSALLLIVLAAAPAWAQKFYPDDPLARDPDDAVVPQPGEVELSTAYDVIEHTFHHRPHGQPPPAANVNTLGAVPDSSWFENRIGVRDMTIEELAHGAATTDGPAGRWTVIAGKSEGITPGFTMRDAAGEVWFVKFDRAQYPVLSTGAEVIAGRFFHAMGYFVPETHIASFRREELAIEPGARITVKGAGKREMTRADLDRVLAHVKREHDGTLRAVVSRRLPGLPLGPHKYHGTRSDDANDVFPHEDRRELRGLRVFSAWLNHDDSRGANTLDTYVPPGYVKHHLIDFSSTLGSGSDATREIGPQNPRAGNEYIVDWGPIARAAASFGIADRAWRRVRYRDFPEVGNLEADFFDPDRWRPEYPNPAFERMRPEDALWAAHIVARFTPAAIRAMVAVGRVGNPEAEEYLVRTLVARRDKIVDRYFRALNPIDGFRVEGGAIVFENPGERAGLPRADGYEHQWFAVDNAGGRLAPLGEAARSTEARVVLTNHPSEYTMVRIRTLSDAVPAWRQAVDVFLRNGATPEVVGVERETP